MKNVENATKEVSEEKETHYLKGKLNTHEKALPELKLYGNGTLRMTGQLVHKVGEDFKYQNFIAYNQIAEKLNTAISLDERTFTLSGEIRNNALYVKKAQMHKLLSIEGTIKHIEEKDNSMQLRIGTTENNIPITYFASVQTNKELNGAVLEVDQMIAINGEGTIFDKKDLSRATDIKAWNVASDIEKLNEVIKTTKARSPEMSPAS